MSTLRTCLPLVVLAFASLLGDRLCHTAARRDDPERLMHAASENLRHFPDRIGTWRAVAAEPLSANAVRMLQCRFHESRVYIDDQTGEKVYLILLVGPAGPLVAHTPEVCYASREFKVVDAAHPITIRGSGPAADVFDVVEFQAGSVMAERHRAYYGWHSVTGRWQAPHNPRLTLGGQPMLYKLQLSLDPASFNPAAFDPVAHSGDAPLETTGPPLANPAEKHLPSDPGRRFLAALLPVLDRLLQAD